MAIILPHGVLFINASEHFEKDKRQNRLLLLAELKKQSIITGMKSLINVIITLNND